MTILLMKRSQGLTSLATLHHVAAALALLAMIGRATNPAASANNANFIVVMQLTAFAFLTVIIRRAWASIDYGNPAKTQGLLWVPFFNFYWVFPAFVTLATQTNAKADAEGAPEAKITRGFGLVIAILFCVTSITDLSPAIAWLHLVIYAIYVGFEITYIWQIKKSADVFDAKSAPPLAEPNKMPTVGVAGIILGSAVAVLILASINVNFLMTPEIIDQRLKAKGYSTRVIKRDGLGGYIDRAILRDAGVIELKEIQVFKGAEDYRMFRDPDRRAGFVLMATGNFNDESEKIIQSRLNTRTLRNGNMIFFKACLREPEREDVDVNNWLSSF